MKRSLLQRSMLLLAALSGMAVPATTQAVSVYWGSTFEQDTLLDAAGNALGAEFSFEIGTFSGGFVPTLDNLNNWAANWRVMDRAFDATPGDLDDPDEFGWNSTLQFFVGTAVLNGDGTSQSQFATPDYEFVQGTVMYIWVYNTKNREAGTEWALVRDSTNIGDNGDDWVVPDPLAADDDPLNNPTILLSDADQAIYGGVRGPGYTIQTSLVPVPEPGSMILAGVTALGALLQRRRRTSHVSAN